MRKRQKPYVLIVVLVICGALVAFMNTPPSKPSVANPTPDPNASPKTGGEVSTTPKGAVAASVASEMQTAKKPKVNKPGRGLMLDEPESAAPAGPVILKPKYIPSAPKPNDSSTAGQWYEQNAAKSYSGDKAAAAGNK